MSNNVDVIKLASIVSDAKDEDIPKHLLQIKRLLQQHPALSSEQQSVKLMLLNYDLLSWCVVVLKYDFAKLDGGYATAVSIIEILFDCCVGLNFQEAKDFLEVSLPDAVDSALAISWQIQQRIIDEWKLYGAIKYGVHAEEGATLKLQYQAVIESLSKVLTSQVFLVNSFLKSDNLIRILIEEGSEVEKILVAALELVLLGVRVNPSAVRNLSTQSINHLLDELIFKLTSSESDAIAGVTVKIVVTMVDAYPDLANKMTVRFKALKALLTRWIGHGFDRALRSLMEILDAGNAKLAELARRTRAVKTIWAAYQGWKARTRVARLHKVVPSLQSSFRRKRQQKLKIALRKKLGNEQKYKSELERKRSVRSTREKQLQMLEIVPASKVSQHIQLEERKAAVQIQSVWRGAVQRKRFTKEKYIQRTSSAAVVIQRAVRRFLKRRRKLRTGFPQALPIRNKLTRERREELQMKIDQRRMVRGEKETSMHKAEEIHNEAQHRLMSYHTRRAEWLQVGDTKLQALLAKLHTEQELLENLPKLSDAEESEISGIAHSSNAVSLAAEGEHKRMMKEFTLEWWQKLALKSGKNLDPFEEKLNVEDRELQEIEHFLNEADKKDILFG